LTLSDEVYQIHGTKVFGIVLSVINISLITPLLVYIIWFEKFVSDKRKME
jgi:hypothetical protein